MSFGLPHDISEHGWRFDQALDVTHVFISILLAVSFGWMAWAIAARRRRERSEYFRGDNARGPLLPLGIAAAVFLIVDGHLFYTSVRDNAEVFHDYASALRTEGALRLQVSGRQWAWDARYPGVDDRFGTADDVYVTTEIRVPRGRPVIVQLASVDVVHAFHLPNLRVQMDAIPGTLTSLWFEAAETGAFEIVCSQYCGVNHYKMAGVLRVLEPDEFDAWLKQASDYAIKMERAEAELEAGRQEPPLFPSFGSEPDIAPRDWGWPWEDPE